MIEYFVLLLIVATTLIYKKCKEWRKLPPGPFGLPVVGYYPFMGKDPVVTLNKLSDKYGEILNVNLLGESFWILNSHEAVEEAFVTKGDIFAGRPNKYKISQVSVPKYVGNIEGDRWKAIHTFVVAHLSHLGMGKSEFETTIHNLLDTCDSYIDGLNGELHDFAPMITNFSANLVNVLVCGKCFDPSDQDFIELRDYSTGVFESLEYCNMLLTGNLFKLFMRLTKQKTINRFEESMNNFIDYYRRLIDERRMSFDEKNCKDLLDFWLKEINQQRSTHFNYEDLPQNIAGIIMDGTETTAAVLYHCLHLMALNPQVQERVFTEINETIGTERDFSYADRERMPYTQAVLCEIQRVVLLAAFGITHVTRAETTLRGYKVPKRQLILPNYFRLSRDAKHFANPNEFDANNFLDEAGHFKPNKALIQFGIGYRKCPGYKLAEVGMFIAFVRLMRKAEWKRGESEEFKLPKTVEGALRMLRPFKVTAISRK